MLQCKLEACSHHNGRALGWKAGIRRAQGLNAALIVATLDLEEALITPGGVPAVGNEPVVGARFGAPANDLHGVATLRGKLPDVLAVDTSLVGHEALVDLEGNLDRTIGHDLLLHGLNAIDGTDGGGLSPGEWRAIGAFGGTGRSVAATCTIWEAGVSEEASIFDVLPCAREHTSLAAHITMVAAHHVLRRQNRRCLLVGNGLTITHDLRSRECPARTAALLIADWMNQALPIGPGIEVRWNAGDVQSWRKSLELMRCVHKTCAEKVAGIIEGHAIKELVGTSNPRCSIQGIVAVCEGWVIDLCLRVWDGTWCAWSVCDSWCELVHFSLDSCGRIGAKANALNWLASGTLRAGSIGARSAEECAELISGWGLQCALCVCVGCGWCISWACGSLAFGGAEVAGHALHLDGLLIRAAAILWVLIVSSNCTRHEQDCGSTLHDA